MRRFLLVTVIVALFAVVNAVADDEERPGAPRLATPRIVWTLQFHKGFRDPHKMKKLKVEEPDKNVFSDGVEIDWQEEVIHHIVLHEDTDKPEAYYYFMYTIGNYEDTETYPGFAGSPTDRDPSLRGREEDRKFFLDVHAFDEFGENYSDLHEKEVKVAIEEKFFPPLPADVVERNVWKERVNHHGERNKIIELGLHTSYVVWDKHDVTIPDKIEYTERPVPTFQADQSSLRNLNLPVIKNKTNRICLAVFKKFRKESKNITIKIKGITNFQYIYNHEDLDKLREKRDELKKKKFKKEAKFVAKLIAAVTGLKPKERVIHRRELYLKYSREGEDYYRLEDTFTFEKELWVDTIERIRVQLPWNSDYPK
ncbi:MAG: hypothetical protein E3J72_06155 [Planctomycetota bacterium]|nr:MAG: hypothetical protein E3J72_06155 [Planctomycetota bacterium]